AWHRRVRLPAGSAARAQRGGRAPDQGAAATRRGANGLWPAHDARHRGAREDRRELEALSDVGGGIFPPFDGRRRGDDALPRRGLAERNHALADSGRVSQARSGRDAPEELQRSVVVALDVDGEGVDPSLAGAMAESGDHPGSKSLALPLVDDDDREL